MVDVLEFAVGEFVESGERRVDKERHAGFDSRINHGFSLIDLLMNKSHCQPILGR
jgi:hypothetical protein